MTLSKCPFWLAIAAAISVLACTPKVSTLPHPEAGSPLVVAVVIDQLGAAQLERFLPYLSEEGAFKTGIRNGAYFSKAAYPYAGTYTAPGHTTIYCGAGPWKCGVVTNRFWSPEAKRTLPIMDSGKYSVLGRDDKHASPSRIRVNTVADTLKNATRGMGKVASISMKDRAAIPGAGHKADLAAWFDWKAGGFTTSTYYSKELPEWLSRWRTENAFTDAIQPWVPQNPSLLKAALGEDSQTGEGQCLGVTSSFPYDPMKGENPSYLFKMTPQSTGYLLDLGREAIESIGLGKDDTPDLLAISISAVDYAGHLFGPDSWEYLETLIQADAALGEFLRELSEKTEISVLITSDHGVGALPERIGKGGRIFAPTFAKELNAELTKTFGKGDWVAAYSSPFFYLGTDGNRERQKIVPAAIRFLNAKESVQQAFDSAATLGRINDADPLLRSVAQSLYPGEGGEIFVVPAPFYVVDEAAPRAHGTSHGSPWDYDRLVPIVMWGPGIKQRRVDEEVSVESVASTLAAMLKVLPPVQAKAPALF